MPVTVRYFASLREALGRERDELELGAAATVGDLWQRIKPASSATRVLAAVNQQHADFSTPVRDGDEVAFFPPVTGG